MKLTEQTIKDLKPAGTRYTRSENGLAVEVMPSGKKTFCFWFKSKKHTIGRWPDEWSLKDARTEFTRLKVDLQDAPTAISPATTFRDFVEGPYQARAAAQRKRGDLTMQRLRFVYMVKHPLIADMKLNRITAEHIDQLKVEMMAGPDGFAASTAKRELSDLKHVFNKACQWGYLKRSPAEYTSMPKVDRGATKLYLSDSEFTRLEKSLDEWKSKALSFDYGFNTDHTYGRGYFGNPTPLWFYVLVKILINTGLRKGEAITLTWGDIDFEDNRVTVRGDRAKTGQTRIVPISKKLLEDLTDWYHQAHDEELIDGDPDRPVLIEPNPDERVFPVDTFRKPWQRLRQMAKLDKTFTPHILRHHFASTLVNRRGVPIPTAQKLLGHSDVQTTMRYLSVRDRDLVEAIDLL